MHVLVVVGYNEVALSPIIYNVVFMWESLYCSPSTTHTHTHTHTSTTVSVCCAQISIHSLCSVYYFVSAHFFTRLSSLATYYIPKDGPLVSYKVWQKKPYTCTLYYTYSGYSTNTGTL